MRLAPNWPSDVTAELSSLPGGFAGVAQTIGTMRALANAGKCEPFIRETATNLIYLTPPKSDVLEAYPIFEFVRDQIRYTKDVNNVETIQTPEKTLQLRLGDCDDKSTLLAALLESVGHPTRFIVAGYQAPGMVEHVYLEVLLDGEWIPLDATEFQAFGWEPPNPLEIMVEQI